MLYVKTKKNLGKNGEKYGKRVFDKIDFGMWS